MIFDPLISAYDKQVDERGKLTADSPRAKRLLSWEQALFQRADRVIADTPAHADYFAQVLKVGRKNIEVVYVGAEEYFSDPSHHAPGPNVNRWRYCFTEVSSRCRRHKWLSMQPGSTRILR